MGGGTGTGKSYYRDHEVPMDASTLKIFHHVNNRVSERLLTWPKGVDFITTNESLESIVNALEPTAEDTVLAICGCGDQPFALAQTGARVHAVDYKKEQIAYAKRRARLAELGRHVDFLSVSRSAPGDANNLRYLANEERWRRIRANINKISFHHADIFKLPRSLHRTYTKIYLSNAITYSGRTPKDREIEQLIRVLQPNGLLYLAVKTDHIEFSAYARERLRVDVSLTYDARRTEKTWTPSVYRRV